MRYCIKCLNPDTRPQVHFNEEGICRACVWEEEKKDIDWHNRELLLKIIATQARVEAHKRGVYDAVLGVSGGKDSLFTALYAKDKLGLNCLLVSAFPDEISEIGKQNFDNLINHGFDCIRVYVDINLVKKTMKEEFLKYCHFRKANEFPLWASTFTVAKEKNIPLVIQGENAALTLGAATGMNDDGDASTIYKTNTLAGESAIQHFSYINPKYLQLFKFPDLTEWKQEGGRAIWLNYYVKEYSSYYNAQFAINNGLKVRTEPMEDLGRIHPWTCLDSDMHIVSQCHKYYKYGFGFATDEICADIRENRLTRDEGIELIKKYDGKCARRYIQKFCNFIGITEKEHWQTVSKFAKYDPWNRWKEQTEGIL